MTPLRAALAASAAVLLSACAKHSAVVVREPVPEAEVRRGNSTTVHTLGIPPGQLPRAGQCRVWVRGVPPGRQARARSCRGIAETAPAGSWIVYRPAAAPNAIHVHVVDDSRPGIVVMVRHYDIDGNWLRDEEARNHRDADDDDDDRGRGRGRRRNN